MIILTGKEQLKQQNYAVIILEKGLKFTYWPGRYTTPGTQISRCPIL